MKALVVEKDKLRKNIDMVKKRADHAMIFGVLKGNGYGLGLIELARILRDDGISRFAVTEPSDALRLRGAGFCDEEILIIRSAADEEDIKTIIEACATATVGSSEAAAALNGVAERDGIVIDVHIEIDTGMGRYGFLPGEMDKVLSVYKYMKNLNVTGIYTHFHSAFSNRAATKAQQEALLKVVEAIRAAGFEPGIVHASNSSALFGSELSPLDAVRIGSAFTGRLPRKGNAGLQRVGYLSCPISEIRWLPKGHSVGYGAGFVTRRPTKIAIIPLGYNDGFLVEKTRDIYRLRDVIRYMLSDLKRLVSGGKFYVSIGGRRARVLGHVGLNNTIVDVTNIPCAVGDEAVFDCSPLYVGAHIERRYV